jgi:glycosyltransferase involved in cell wall biosynthesis
MTFNINDKPLVSIIIPFYNTEDYINISINSVIEQTYDNIELILINDGSVDKTAERANSILQKTKLNYKIITQKNAGVSVARNKGKDIAKGKYIYFLDSDDYITNDFIEKMINKCITHDLDMVFCGCDIVENNQVINKYTHLYSYTKEINKGIDILKLDIQGKIHIWTINVMFRKKMLDTKNVKYNAKTFYAEDVEFIYRSLFNAKIVGCIDESLVFYNQRSTSASYKFSVRRFTALGALNRLKHYFSDMSSDKELSQLINNRFCIELLMIYDQYILYKNNNDLNYDNIFYSLSKKNSKSIKKFKVTSKRTLKQNILLKIFMVDYKLYKKIKEFKYKK